MKYKDAYTYVRLNFIYVDGELHNRWNNKKVSTYVTKRGYRSMCVRNQKIPHHRAVWFCVNGIFTDGYEIDHKDHDKTNNFIENLREIPSRQNKLNCPLSKNNKSGFNGVFWDKINKNWVSQIKVKRREIYLGAFDTKEDAILARIHANNIYGFHENHGGTNSYPKIVEEPPTPRIPKNLLGTRSKAVIRMDKDNNEVEFRTMKEAAINIGLKKGDSIKLAIEKNKTIQGFKYKYKRT